MRPLGTRHGTAFDYTGLSVLHPAATTRSNPVCPRRHRADEAVPGLIDEMNHGGFWMMPARCCRREPSALPGLDGKAIVCNG